MMGSVEDANPERFDVLIIGAGLAGICALHHIRTRMPEWRVGVLEAGSGAGGTWFWNRYPGARFDSESLTYAYSWDQDLIDNWHWKETFSSQPETLKYLEHVCDKHDLYKYMHFNTRIESVKWQDMDRTWLFTSENGQQYRARFFVSCMGFLSAPTPPNISGLKSFRGRAFHTARWPKDLDASRDFAGKRIGVIGTGATGVQMITEIAKMPVESLTVFQRTPTWAAPLRNSKISLEEMAEYRKQQQSIFDRCAQTPACFIHDVYPHRSRDATPEERLALWEKLYAEPGFGKWLGVYWDTYLDREANKLYSDFMADKIRKRVDDPKLAEQLIPKNHGFGTKRVPLDSGYFEAYNKPNVHLVDLQQTPIERITERGIHTSNNVEYDLDIIIFATGFDAFTGAFEAIDFRGKGGKPLNGNLSTEEGLDAIWKDHNPRTYLGLTVQSMPNMFMCLGPHQPTGNAGRAIEFVVDVIVNLLQYCRDNSITYVEPTEEAVDAWTKEVMDASHKSLMAEVDSWITGVNKNVTGKHVRRVLGHGSSMVVYRQRCEDVEKSGWEGLDLK